MENLNIQQVNKPSIIDKLIKQQKPFAIIRYSVIMRGTANQANNYNIVVMKEIEECQRIWRKSNDKERLIKYVTLENSDHEFLKENKHLFNALKIENGIIYELKTLSLQKQISDFVDKCENLNINEKP